MNWKTPGITMPATRKWPVGHEEGATRSATVFSGWDEVNMMNNFEPGHPRPGVGSLGHVSSPRDCARFILTQVDGTVWEYEPNQDRSKWRLKSVTRP